MVFPSVRVVSCKIFIILLGADNNLPFIVENIKI